MNKVRLNLGKLLFKAGLELKNLGNWVTGSKSVSSNKNYEDLSRLSSLSDWYQANGDKTLRLEYDLNENSIVFDVGGYEGQWASDIFSIYNCNIYVFEPVYSHFEFIDQRFRKNNKIKTFNFGLGNASGNSVISLDGASSSVHLKNKGNSEEIFIKNVQQVFNELSIDCIDLMKVNIEGAEYDLIESLIDEGNISRIKNIQVQFHNFIKDSFSRLNKIRSKLEETHECTYQFTYVWENWKIKGK